MINNLNLPPFDPPSKPYPRMDWPWIGCTMIGLIRAQSFINVIPHPSPHPSPRLSRLASCRSFSTAQLCPRHLFSLPFPVHICLLYAYGVRMLRYILRIAFLAGGGLVVKESVFSVDTGDGGEWDRGRHCGVRGVARRHNDSSPRSAGCPRTDTQTGTHPNPPGGEVHGETTGSPSFRLSPPTEFF